ncbi:hypothetical protein HYW59_02875 [Candidatus Kaiserbacteria bacterium]|nr:hypothetical protein [Candidatus Kaiserbacteria bacterium]
MWQDTLLGFSIWVLLAALVPTLLSQTKKPTFLTSIATGIALSAITIAYVSLEFWTSALPSALMAGAWFLLAYQRYRIDARKGD